MVSVKRRQVVLYSTVATMIALPISALYADSPSIIRIGYVSPQTGALSGFGLSPPVPD